MVASRSKSTLVVGSRRVLLQLVGVPVSTARVVAPSPWISLGAFIPRVVLVVFESRVSELALLLHLDPHLPIQATLPITLL